MKTLNLSHLSALFAALVLAAAPAAAQNLKLSVEPAELLDDGSLALSAGHDAEIVIRSSKGGQEVWLQLAIPSDDATTDGLQTALFHGQTDIDGMLREKFVVPDALVGRTIHAQAYAVNLDGEIEMSNALKVSIRKADASADGERNTAWAPPAAVERSARPAPEPEVKPAKPAPVDGETDDADQVAGRYMPLRREQKRGAAASDGI